uniref:Uncharacterized protein n=1 Tax=Meloidogyne incognita TaxID=6306 RepID=A0A914KKB9_MELIC
MPKFVLAQSVGAIVSHLLAILSDFILSKEDIASMDAEIISDLLESLIDECKKILMVCFKFLEFSRFWWFLNPKGPTIYFFKIFMDIRHH